MPLIKTFSSLLYPNVINKAISLPHSGPLLESHDRLVYLKLQDDYIHELLPILQSYEPQVEQPNYFGPQRVGAHLSVIYPEENIVIQPEELKKIYEFEVTGLYSMTLDLKRYYVLGVKSSALIQFRERYDLGEKLLLKGYLIDLHITIGVIYPKNQK